MASTAEWLDRVLANEQELYHWLTRQYVGEVTAARRISNILDQYPDLPESIRKCINKIVQDEIAHAEWVKGLLETRNIPLPSMDGAEERYWKPVLNEVHNFETVAAAGHHAESMRLVRITALANDERVPHDIRSVFARILPDEQFHAVAFGRMSTPEAIAEMAPHHQAGLEMLGLEI